VALKSFCGKGTISDTLKILSTFDLDSAQSSYRELLEESRTELKRCWRRDPKVEFSVYLFQVQLEVKILLQHTQDAKLQLMRRSPAQTVAAANGNSSNTVASCDDNLAKPAAGDSSNTVSVSTKKSTKLAAANAMSSNASAGSDEKATKSAAANGNPSNTAAAFDGNLAMIAAGEYSMKVTACEKKSGKPAAEHGKSSTSAAASDQKFADPVDASGMSANGASSKAKSGKPAVAKSSTAAASKDESADPAAQDKAATISSVEENYARVDAVHVCRDFVTIVVITIPECSLVRCTCWLIEPSTKARFL